MEVSKRVQVFFTLVVVIVVMSFISTSVKNSKTTDDKNIQSNIAENLDIINDIKMGESSRVVSVADTVVLPIDGIVPSNNVKHSIPIDEIRKGCFRQDCIPSVDSPEFMDVKSAFKVLDSESIGIALSYANEERFYPFPMLETHELVNDVIAGNPLLISYCPLCGTGIVFERTVQGLVYEFGVSGMLWQSNLLMYNRSSDIEDRNLWSQVLGEAVVGESTGVQLQVVSSDIMKFGTWSEQNPLGSVLTTGNPRDPYGGEYFSVAQRFAPSFDVQTSAFAPDMYVYGIEVDGVFKAYPRDLLPQGEIHDMISGEDIIIINTAGKVQFSTNDGDLIKDVEGFWFSWYAVHPQTEVWSNNN